MYDTRGVRPLFDNIDNIHGNNPPPLCHVKSGENFRLCGRISGF